MAKFRGYVYTAIPVDDVAHALKWGVKFPDDYKVKGIKFQSSVENIKNALVITADAPNVEDGERYYVEAVRCDNGYKVRRWQPEK